jgi:RNA polymerase sigma factor (sigma-70 family)
MANAQLGTVLRQLSGMVHARGYEEASDRDLLGQFIARQDEAAFVALLKRHGPMVLQVCRRIQGNEHDAEDAFQATFLLLARKAGSIRKQESVASWLHGVAHRLALAARGQDVRRQARARQAADMRRTSPTSDRAWQELQATLDEALRQVPETYRAPLLLCYLEGKTQEEAARLLGCPLGTVRSRLARGRDRLRAVLERQGVRLSTTALVAALVGSGASTALPAPLLKATARAALGYAAGTAQAALVSTRVVTLLERGLQTMATAKLGIASAVLLVMSVLGLGTAVLVSQALAGPPQPLAEAISPTASVEGKQEAAAAPEGRDSRDEKTLRGRVLGSDGQPFAGAKLLLFGPTGKPTEVGTSGPDGGFALVVPRDAAEAPLIAQADGSGLDFLDFHDRKSGAPVELRLVKDRVIRGRIVDTQGKPVAGARVAISHLNVYAGNLLDPFLAEWKKRHFMSGLPSGVKHLWRETGDFLRATTGADGRFTLAGVGVERMAGLRISGPGIGDAEVLVVNRDGFDPKPYNEASRDNVPKGLEYLASTWLLYGPDLALVAEAEKPISGMVTAADTGKPRPGVVVWLTRDGDNLLPLILTAKTDAAGRYEIRGARKAQSSYMVEVKSDPAAGYVACQVRAADTPGYAPVTADIRVHKGVVVTGKVIDKTTGKPVPGFAMASVLSDNPHVKDYPEFNGSAWMATERTAADGTFRVVTIPGPVLLMGGPDHRHLGEDPTASMKYKPAVPDPQYPQYFHKYPEDGAVFFVPGNARSPVQGNYCKVLQIKPGTAVVEQDIVLEQAPAVAVQIRDAEGRPVRGAWVTGISPQNWERPVRIAGDSCSAYLAEPDRSRLMVFYEPERKWIGTLTFKGEVKGPVVATLGPAGSVRGRLLGEDGKPVAGVVVEVSHAAREAREIHDHIHRTRQAVTDAGGVFQVEEVIPEIKFTLYYHRKLRESGHSRKVADRQFQVKPGEALDLGDLRLTPPAKKDGE